MQRRLPALLALIAVAAFVTLAFVNAVTTSPTSDELTHLAAGLSYLRTGDLRLNREHPPLLKAIAAIPLWMTPLLPDESVARDAATRLRDAWAIARSDNASQWRFADLFFYGVTDEALRRSGGNNDHVPTLAPFARSDFINDTERLFLRGRAMMILIGALLAVLVFVWARQLWGAAGGVIAVFLIAFDPNFIAHSALVTTDTGVTLFMTATLYFFWRATRTSGSG
ncbi:MAG TPA: glycosyltransferase family 39 protein, partial [Thermoanaerobaculia bacterium]|nr:glycosyltransferase family 39 protein [Thermoanaerobaculia bacterium]